MEILSLLFFAAITYCLGYTCTAWITSVADYWDRHIMRIGIGIGAFVVVAVLFNAVGLPLHWLSLLIVSMLYPAWNVLVKKVRPSLPSIEANKTNLITLVLLVLFLGSAYMYISGSFAYPYLENDDPWGHAEGVKYVAVEKQAFDTSRYDFDYIDPYPPGYDILMGVIHQTNDSIYWTLKFFNGLLLAIGGLLFFFFAKRFTHHTNLALFATFVLMSLPSFFTHFIWAHGLVIILIFPALYALEMARDDKRWLYTAAIIIGSIALTQPSQAIKIGIMLGLYVAIKSIYAKKIAWGDILAGVGGLLISLLWWLPRGSVLLGKKVAKHVAEDGPALSLFQKFIAIFPADAGTATRAYTFADFVFAKPFGGINVQVGWGWVVSILIAISLITIVLAHKQFLKEKRAWVGITLAWFIFAFLGTNSVTFNLPVGFIAFRFWLLLAIPVALLSALSLQVILSLVKDNRVRTAIVLLFVVGILITSASPKFQHNTMASWPPGVAWQSIEEVQTYVSLQDLPPDTRVFTFSTNDKHITGLDKYSCFWCEDVVNYRSQLNDTNAEELHDFLTRNEYEYVMFSAMSFKTLGKRHGQNETDIMLNTLISNLSASPDFIIDRQSPGAILFRLI